MRILGVLGDFYHEGDALRKLFQAGGGAGWTLVGRSEFDRVDLSEFDIVVVAAEDRLEPEVSAVRWMTDEIANRLTHFVEAGGGLLAFHSGLASYAMEGAYTTLVGGAFQFHPKAHPRFRFVPGTERHPLLDGVEAFDAEDELYFVWRDASTTRLLASVESAEYGSSSALWYAPRGRGRVVALTLGHRAEVLSAPPVVRLVANALAWLSGVTP